MNAVTISQPEADQADTFRPCYLCGMPRLDLDLCDRCADACVADAKRFECRQLVERAK